MVFMVLLLCVLVCAHSSTLAGPTDLVKRQAYFQRTLEATYHYHCPMSGSEHRSFSWHAIWHRSDSQINVKGVSHITFIGELTIEPPDFRTFWVGTHCIELEEYVCVYVFTGRTEGALLEHGIVMFLVTDSNDASQRPKVSENCMLREELRDPNACPSMFVGDSIKACTVDNVEVRVVL